jgi:hypothetical protein
MLYKTLTCYNKAAEIITLQENSRHKHIILHCEIYKRLYSVQTIRSLWYLLYL